MAPGPASWPPSGAPSASFRTCWPRSAITGLAASLHTSALAFQILEYLGAAYLLYLAWNMLRDKGPLVVPTGAAPPSNTKVIVSGVLVNILNPKLTIFFFGFLPQVVSTNAPGALASMLQLSGIFMLLTFVVFIGYGVFAAAVWTHVISRPTVLTWMRRSVGVAVVALGARLALTER